MTWDATAIAVGIKSIGQVESSMNYAAINGVDPITVGLFQWFGVRAAAILRRMVNENSATMPANIASDLAAHSDTDSFWNTRYLTGSEVTALRPILIANQPIQDNQASLDLDDYKTTGVNLGIDKDGNTQTLLFFCNMYNQSPRNALRVLSNAGPSSSLDRIYSYCLNDSVLGQYRTRYTDAYNIIKNMDSSGVGDTTGSGGSTDPGGNSGSTRPETDIKYLTMVGDTMHIRFRDHHTLIAVPDGKGHFIPREDNTLGSDVPGDVTGDPATGDVATAMKDWLIAHNNVYAYSQGTTRLEPDKNNYTDCSGLMYWVYKTIANIYIGTWTGDQSTKGKLITTNPDTAKAETSLQVGDLVFYRWHASSPSTYDHVAMYIGSNQIESHGGPDPGPDMQSHSGEIDYAISGGGSIMVRRYL